MRTPYNFRQPALPKKQRRVPRWLKLSLIVLAVLAGLFVLANLVMGLLYRNKVLPNYSVAGISISNAGFGQLDSKVPVEKLLPPAVSFKKDDKVVEVAPKDLGIAVDWEATRDNIKKSRSWLPIASLVTKRSVPAELKLDNAKFATAAKD